jgi:hypothetical protein
VPHTIIAVLKLVIEVIHIILRHTSLCCLRLSFMLAKSIGFIFEVLDFVACLSYQLSPTALDLNLF